MKKLFLLIAGVYLIHNFYSNKTTNDVVDYVEDQIESTVVESTKEIKEVINVKDSVENVVESQGTGGPEKVYSEEAKQYFKEIALKTEFDGDRKKAFVWTTDMKIFVDGQKPEYLMNELRKIVAELNVIIDPIDIKIVSNKSESNYIVYFGSHTDFNAKYKVYSPQRLNNNWGYFEVSSNSGKMYVDLVRNGDVESYKHLLREELTQSLGLFNDSWDYPESIFYQGWTTTTEYAPIDRELIDMLYNN
jgi:hypothetical protein